jgi:hypothetical protein
MSDTKEISGGTDAAREAHRTRRPDGTIEANHLPSGYMSPKLAIYWRTDIGLTTPYEITWASAYASWMPGCCGLTVLHNFSIQYNYNPIPEGVPDDSLYAYFLDDMTKFARDAKFGCAIYTTTSGQSQLINALMAQGWKPAHTFKNKRTERNVTIWIKDL